MTSKEELLKNFTKEQLLGLYFGACMDWQDNEGTGANVISLTVEEAQSYYDTLDVRSPVFKEGREGIFSCQIINCGADLHTKYYYEELDGLYGGGVYISDTELVIYIPSKYCFEIHTRVDGHSKYLRQATEEELQLCAKKIEEMGDIK